MPYAGWMRFAHLDESAGLQAAFTLAYKITDDGAELWSERFNRFKNINKPSVYGAAEVLTIALPQLLGELGAKPGGTVIIPALSSREEAANPKRALPIIAGMCAQKFGARAEIGAISKKVHRPIHGLGGAAERAAELDGAAYQVKHVKATTIIVLDDFITRGGTLSRIAQAALATNPGSAVYGVALGKTERRAWIHDLSNDHVPQQWDGLWRKGEQAYNAKQK